MSDTGKYEGTGFGPTKGYEVIWIHEDDERNWDNMLGGAMERPRPLFAHYKSAYEYCNETKLKSRALILEYRKGVSEGWEDEYEVVKDTRWGTWGGEEE